MEVQLCYEIKTFLLAGHETSAAMLTWSVLEMSRIPKVLEGVRAEGARLHGARPIEEVPTRAEVETMDYTLGTLKEALRKYSVVPVVTRMCTQDDELCGYKIPKGCWIMVSLQGVHNSWKDPKEFRPERFLKGGELEQFDEETRPYMFLPFIVGPRNCLGQHLALLEARVVLSYLAHK